MEAAMSTIIEVALEQGIWAALYIYLFFRMLKENAEREKEYQAIISNLSGHIQEGIDSIQDRLDDIESFLPHSDNCDPTSPSNEVK